jgi:hypothetical protein
MQFARPETRLNNKFVAGALFENRSAEGLTEDQIRRVAPSVFATQAHESRSARFTPIPTIEAVRGLVKEGFVPVSVRQGGSRIPGKSDFTKHLIRFRARHELGQGNDERTPELLLLNANDGTSSWRVMGGVFRAICKNGLIAADLIEDFKIGHTGDIVDRVIEGTYKVLGETQRVIQVADHWRGITLHPSERAIFAEAVHTLRLGDASEATRNAIRPEQFLAPRRQEDRRWDLWTTANVAQEHAMQGGLRGVAHIHNPETRQHSTRQVSVRPVGSVDGDTVLNRALWTLTTKMAELAGA